MYHRIKSYFEIFCFVEDGDGLGVPPEEAHVVAVIRKERDKESHKGNPDFQIELVLTRAAPVLALTFFWKGLVQIHEI